MTKVLLWYWGRRGGGPNYTLQVATVLAKQPGIELHLSVSRQCVFFEQFAALNLPGFYLNTYSDRTTALAALVRLPKIKEQFRQYLVQHQIQIVYCTMDHLWNAVMLPAIKQAGARYVFTLHDAEPHPGDNGGVGRFRQWLFSRDIRAADYIITLTEHVRTQLHQLYHYPLKQTSVIPHGVFDYGTLSSAGATADSFKPAQSSGRKFPGRGMHLLFFGRILPYKGLHLLLQAFKMLKPEFPLTLTVAGSGSLAAYTELTAPDIKVDNRHIPEAEIAAIFHQADLLIAPYLEASQSGVVAIAMGAALPVVATPVGGLQEQVIHNRTGYIAQEVSAEAIAQGIRQFLLDPQLYEACSEQALEQVSRCMDWTAIGKQVTAVIQTLND